MASTSSSSSFSIHDFNSLEKEVAEVLLQLQILIPSFSSPFLIRTWFSKGRRSAINVEPSLSPPSSPLPPPPPPPPPPSNKVDQEQPETTTSSRLSPNSPLSFPLLSDNIDYQSKNPLKKPMKKKIKIVKEETSMLLSVPPLPPTTKITLNPKPSLSFFLPGDNNINNIVQKKPQTSSFSSNHLDVRKKGLMMISSGQQVRFKQVSNNNPVVTTEFTLGPTTSSPQQKSNLQPLINNINHQTTANAAGLGQVSVSNTKSYPKCLKAITSIMNTMTSEKTIRMSYNPTISTSTTTPAVSEQTRKRKFEVQ